MAFTKKQQALLKAVQSGNLQRVKSLLAQGYDPNPAAYSVTTPLHDAVRRGYLGIVKALVEAGADINAENLRRTTALDVAFQQNLAEDPRAPAILRYLKQQGALRAHELEDNPSRKTPSRKPHIVPKKQKGPVADWPFPEGRG